jgi:hypothetical protein
MRKGRQISNATVLGIHAGMCFLVWNLGVVAGMLTAPFGLALQIRVTIGFWVVSLLFAGTALYVLRRAFRLVYGLVEIAAAIGIVSITFIRALELLPALIDWKQFDPLASAGTFLQLAAALYVFVRGLDNVEKGLKPEWLVYGWWNALFTTEK